MKLEVSHIGLVHLNKTRNLGKIFFDVKSIECNQKVNRKNYQETGNFKCLPFINKVNDINIFFCLGMYYFKQSTKLFLLIHFYYLNNNSIFQNPTAFTKHKNKLKMDKRLK